MKYLLIKVALLIYLTGLISCSDNKTESNTPQPKVQESGILTNAKIHETPHYRIFSTATFEQTAQVAIAVEALYSAYSSIFALNSEQKKFELVLYKNQSEFRKYNQSSPWAEAYYKKPRSYAYYADGKNPYHWMLHEATHQLLREASGYKPEKWTNEGIASYFGTSTLIGSELQAGNFDTNTYPIWWLSTLNLSGNLKNDIERNTIIPLQQLLTNTGPDININVNLYYMHYWSISHFLMHYDNGRYSKKYKELIALGGNIEDFEKLIGPVDQIQNEWYEYLNENVNIAKSK